MDPVLAGFLGGLIPSGVAVFISWRDNRRAETQVHARFVDSVRRVASRVEDMTVLRRDVNEFGRWNKRRAEEIERLRNGAGTEQDWANLRTLQDEYTDFQADLASSWSEIERHAGTADEALAEWRRVDTELRFMDVKKIDSERLAVGKSLMDLIEFLGGEHDPKEVALAVERVELALDAFVDAGKGRARKLRGR